MTANIGETATATFDVLGADLTGNVTVTVDDANGVYTVNPTTISKADAEEGATITVTYAPTATGTHQATVTVTSEGAQAVTVTLNGTATMQTVAPVMAAATNVGTTSFTATWTDETLAQNVKDYTLYVNKAGGISGLDLLLSETFGGVTAENDGTARIESNLDDYCDNAGWTGSYIYQAGGGGLKLGNSSNGGTLVSPALDMTNSGWAATVVLNAKNFGSDVTTLTVSCGSASETIELTDAAVDYTVTLVMNEAAAGQHVTISSSGSKQRFYLYKVDIYSGGFVKGVSETGDANHRTITGITDKTYTVENLAPGETYNFYVVANYVDGSNAASNIEQVTLVTAVVPEIIVDPETLAITANVGETVTATFDVLAAELTGDVTVTLTDNPAKEVTVTVDMTVSRITDQEFAADCKRVVTIGGIKMEPTKSSLQFSRVSKDYSQDILGTWEGRVSSSEGSEHDDGELHRWEYRSDGSYSYYRQDEKGNWVDDVNVHSEYFCDGTLLCTRWKNPGQPEMRESWEIDSIENGVMKWKALRVREDKTTYTATFQMTKVK